MNTRLLSRARRLFSSDLVADSINRHNIRAWVQALRVLGPRWIGLPQRLERKV